MELKLVEGPWKKIFEGNLQGHSVELRLNPDFLLLLLIFDETNGEKTGAAIELFQAFNPMGEIETFLETLPREVIGITKHDEKSTTKFFLLGSGATYSRLDEESLSAETRALLKKLKNSSTLIKDVSKAYDFTLKELKECNEDMQDAFLSEPLIVPFISSSNHSIESGMQSGETKPAVGEILLGTSKDGTPIKEPAAYFSKTIIEAGKLTDRMRALHVVIEGLLISNVPIVLFDQTNSFDGLREPSKNPQGLKQIKAAVEPLGFPVKDFNAWQDLKIDLSTADSDSLLEEFGIGSNPLNGLVKEVFEKNALAGASDAIQKIASEKTVSLEITDFQKKKAIRLIRLMDSIYPEFFNSKNNIGELSKSWLRGFGRVGLIHLNKIDSRQNALFTHNIINGLIEFYRQKGATKELRAVFIMPEADKIIQSANSSKISQKTMQSILEAEQYGIGWVFGTEKVHDLKSEIASRAIATISIVNENDAGIEFQGQKPYRCHIRPTFSQFTELQK